MISKPQSPLMVVRQQGRRMADRAIVVNGARSHEIAEGFGIRLSEQGTDVP